MPETTFNPIDEDAAAARKEAEAKALAEGERLVAAQEAAQEETYESARRADQETAQYAGKYKSAEELEKAYLELQKKLGERSTDEAPSEEGGETVEASKEEEGEEPEVSETFQALQSASEEYEEGGELSPETLEKLSQLDSKELVEQWVQYVNNSKPEAEPGAIAATAAGIPAESMLRMPGGGMGGQGEFEHILVRSQPPSQCLPVLLAGLDELRQPP